MISRTPKLIFPLLVALLLAASLARATEAPARAPAKAQDIVLAGLEAYREKGAGEAFAAWLKGGNASQDALAQSAQFQRIETFYGKLTGWEVLREQPISATSTLLYVSINYEKGPLFARFHIYLGKEGWLIANFDFNTKPEEIMPGVLLEK